MTSSWSGFDPTAERSFSTFGGAHGVAWSRFLEAEDRAQLLALVAALPSGEPARCHLPAFGLVCFVGRMSLIVGPG
jgi:hypothetical protein